MSYILADIYKMKWYVILNLRSNYSIIMSDTSQYQSQKRIHIEKQKLYLLRAQTRSYFEFKQQQISFKHIKLHYQIMITRYPSPYLIVFESKPCTKVFDENQEWVLINFKSQAKYIKWPNLNSNLKILFLGEVSIWFPI